MSIEGSAWTGTVTTVATAVVVLAGCGGSTPVVTDEPPVAVAEPVPFEATHLEPRPTSSPVADAPPEPSHATTGTGAVSAAPPSPAPSTVGPTSADAAAFVSSDALAGLAGLDHVVVDLDGDDWPEVVVTGVRDRVGVLRVAWWTDGAYEVRFSDEAGPGREVIDLRAADLNRDDHTELLVAVQGDGLQSLALWSVTGRGQVERLKASGGCHDGQHVFGVTTARLQSVDDGPPVIVADCDESPLPVADWSEHRWEWRDGAYRHVEDVPPEPTGDPGEDGAGDGDNDDRSDDPGGGDGQGNGRPGDPGEGGGGPGDDAGGEG